MPGRIAETPPPHNGVFGTTSLRRERFPLKRPSQKTPSPLKLFQPTSPTDELGLTEKEQQEGRIGPDQSYRLPTDAEWSVAVGLKGTQDGTPESKDSKVRDVYPWGTQWPPPRGAGNYDPSLRTDDFERTSPVGSFAANRLGLHDLGGNVWEWCQDFYNGRDGGRVLRGASFINFVRDYLLSSYRFLYPPSHSYNHVGFRVVLTVSPSGS